MCYSSLRLLPEYYYTAQKCLTAAVYELYNGVTRLNIPDKYVSDFCSSNAFLMGMVQYNINSSNVSNAGYFLSGQKGPVKCQIYTFRSVDSFNHAK